MKLLTPKIRKTRYSQQKGHCPSFICKNPPFSNILPRSRQLFFPFRTRITTQALSVAKKSPGESANPTLRKKTKRNRRKQASKLRSPIIDHACDQWHGQFHPISDLRYYKYTYMLIYLYISSMFAYTQISWNKCANKGSYVIFCFAGL